MSKALSIYAEIEKTANVFTDRFSRAKRLGLQSYLDTMLGQDAGPKAFEEINNNVGFMGKLKNRLWRPDNAQSAIDEYGHPYVRGKMQGHMADAENAQKALKMEQEAHAATKAKFTSPADAPAAGAPAQPTTTEQPKSRFSPGSIALGAGVGLGTTGAGALYMQNKSEKEHERANAMATARGIGIGMALPPDQMGGYDQPDAPYPSMEQLNAMAYPEAYGMPTYE